MPYWWRDRLFVTDDIRDALSPLLPAEIEIELNKLSSPRIFLVRMLVFLVLCALVMVVLYKQIITAFFANPDVMR